MMRPIANDRLRQLVGPVISDGDPDSVEGIKYDFRLGNQLLKASFRGPVDMSKLSQLERAELAIAPGEVVFVMIRETLQVPNNLFGMLVPKRKLSHAGIVILGGRLIDPCYVGPLVLGLLNVSSSPFPLLPGRKLIAAIFYELDKDDIVGDWPSPEAQPLDRFPEDLVRLIGGYQPASIADLKETLDKTRREVADLKADFVSGREWQQEFRRSLTQHNELIGSIARDLKAERENRLDAEKSFRADLLSIQRDQMKTATKLGVIIGGIVIVAGAVLAWFLQYVFPSGTP